jgi:hypothetical protein
MRDLGTPVYGRGLFRAALRQFPDHVEVCVARIGRKPVAAGLPIHGRGTTEVPSASSLRQYNSTCANMVMYWSLLVRAIERGTDSESGSRFVERMLSVVATCRQQGVNVLDDLTRCYQAHLDDEPAPSLLPSASTSQAA